MGWMEDVEMIWMLLFVCLVHAWPHSRPAVHRVSARNLYDGCCCSCWTSDNSSHSSSQVIDSTQDVNCSNNASSAITTLTVWSLLQGNCVDWLSGLSNIVLEEGQSGLESWAADLESQVITATCVFAKPPLGSFRSFDWRTDISCNCVITQQWERKSILH